MLSPEAFDQVKPGTPWYRNVILISVLLFCCWPVGVALMWLFAPWSRRTKITSTIAVVVLWLVALGSRATGSPQTGAATAPTAVPAALVAAPTQPTLPTVAATAAPAPKPTAPPPPPTEPPAPTAVPAAEQFVIAGAGPDGVNMRELPNTSAQKVRTLKDGQAVEIVGPDRQEDGRLWKSVRDLSDGRIGWVAADFVQAKSGAPSQEQDPVAAYKGYMTEKVADSRKAFGELGTQLQRFNSNPALINDVGWKVGIGLPLAMLQIRGEELQKYDPVPAPAAELDKLIVEVGKDMIYVRNQVVDALDHGNRASAQNATARMTALAPKMDRVEAGLKALGASAPAAPPAPAAKPAASGGIVCKDGYNWPGTTRQGACNGHGGIR